jgi:hypothetical protein
MVDAPAKPEATPREALAILAGLLDQRAPGPDAPMPEWTRGTMIVPLSFRSGMRSSAPAKPLAELTTDDRRALYLASIGRSYRREW